MGENKVSLGGRGQWGGWTVGGLQSPAQGKRGRGLQEARQQEGVEPETGGGVCRRGLKQEGGVYTRRRGVQQGGSHLLDPPEPSLYAPAVFLQLIPWLERPLGVHKVCPAVSKF